MGSKPAKRVSDEDMQALIPTVIKTVPKAVGKSGYGEITIVFKDFKPTVDYVCRGRAMRDGFPVEEAAEEDVADD